MLVLYNSYVLGIVRFDIAYQVELDTFTRFVDFFTVPNDLFDHERMSLQNESLDDGKRLTFYIRGVDAVESYAQDNVTVTVDLSPPVIENVWITKGEILNLSVHDVLELNKMT